MLQPSPRKSIRIGHAMWWQSLTASPRFSSRLYYTDPIGCSKPDMAPRLKSNVALVFPKKTKKDLFLKNYPITKNSNVRHIIPLFLIRNALSKAYICHADDMDLLDFYKDTLVKCGIKLSNEKPHEIVKKFYSQVAKFRFSVFVGCARENSLLGHYGFRLFNEAQGLTRNISAINYAEDEMVSQKLALRLSGLVEQHLLSALLLNRKTDSFSKQFSLFVKKEFAELNDALERHPGDRWSSISQSVLNTVYRIRDVSVYDVPQGAHADIRKTQQHFLTQAYAHLLDYTAADKLDKEGLMTAFKLMCENERACLEYFPNKAWHDLYPQCKPDCSTNEAFARKVGRSLLMPASP